MLLGCRLFKRCQKISGVGTFLLSTVLLEFRLFKWCRNLPAGHCVAGMYAV